MNINTGAGSGFEAGVALHSFHNVPCIRAAQERQPKVFLETIEFLRRVRDWFPCPEPDEEFLAIRRRRPKSIHQININVYIYIYIHLFAKRQSTRKITQGRPTYIIV